MRLKRHIPLPVLNHYTGEIWFNADGTWMEQEHDPTHFWTIRVDTSFDAEATCPEFDRFLAMITSECIDQEDMIRHIEELGGYIITMSRWLKTWVLFHGATDTGKTTLCDVFAELLGGSCLAAPLSRFGGNYQFAEQSLIGKLVLIDDDFARDDSLPDGFMKKISEEKVITAEMKFADSIQFLCRAVPLICANHWPVTRDVSDAFRERAMVIDFTHRIEGAEKDDQRKAKMLAEELPGILNRFIAGISRLRARGTWEIPLDAAIAHEKWAGGSNAAMLFIDEMMTKEAEGFARRSQVWARYRAWQRDAGGEMMRRSTLFERMDQILGLPMKRRGHYGWTGWALGTPTEEMEDLDD
jgi:putative DNA primase/helicase